MTGGSGWLVAQHVVSSLNRHSIQQWTKTVDRDTFGLAPCPLAAFAFGLLMFVDTRVPKGVITIPFVYAVGGIH